MALVSGARLGPYEIQAAIGAGGMGEVYQARDTRLDRTVAIKILPPEFSADAGRRARFQREAKTIAALTHPHICTLYDLGEHASTGSGPATLYLVMEHLEGETLAARLQRGRLPLDQALTVATEVADALAAAHRQGITHRDLKPGNVMLTRSGAKLLDFGLAKLAGHGEQPAAASLASAPTQTRPLTSEGAIVGTLQYMAPEQVEGKPADSRTDLWALGATLYEMLTGKRAFEGTSAASLIGNIMNAEPPALATLQPLTPPAVEHLVTTCLAKDPEARWQTASDVARQLRSIADESRLGRTPGGRLSGSSAAAALATARRRRGWRLAGALAAVAATVAAASAALTWLVVSTGWWPSTPSGSVTQFSFPIGPVRSLLSTSLAISPDGTELAYTIDGKLFRRSMDALAPVPLASALQGANSCFFVDLEWVGCGHRGKLLKVMMATGASVALSDSASLFGATGLPGDSIVFVPGSAKGMWQVPSQGGERTEMLMPDFAKGERSYRWPAALPENSGLLFAMLTTENSSFDDARIMAIAPGGNDRTVVASGGTFPKYAATGHVLFARSGILHAIPFDLHDRKPTGAAKVVLEGILMDPFDGRASFDISEDGTLVYVPGDVISRNADIVWVDRTGNREPILTDEPVDREIRVSPDGSRLAFEKGRDIWVYDLALRSQVRITFDAAIDTNPVWSHDGRRITFASSRAGPMDIYERSADGSGEVVALYASGLSERPMSWSPDGKTLLFEDLGPTRGTDIKLLTLLGEGKTSVRDFAATAFNEGYASFSPDGKWIAYVSDETGESQVYIQSSDGTAGRRKVSPNGGTEPLWNPTWGPKGGELVFFKGEAALSVSVQTAPTLTVSAPRTLFNAPARITGSRFRNVDISQDGSRFVMMVPREDPKELEIRVILNWFEQLKAMVPTQR